MKNVNIKVGRKFDPLYPKTVKEKRAQLDVIRCALEAAASQFRQCGYKAPADALLGIADQIPRLKRLARPALRKLKCPSE
jgi:hypothetical protein